MTHAAALLLDAHRGGGPPLSSSGARRRWTRTGKQAGLTTVSVALGLVVLTTLLPPPRTPGDVASAFLESWFWTEGSPSPDLLCRSNRVVVDPRFVSGQLVDLDQHHVLPYSVDVQVDDVRPVRGSRTPSFTVSVTATSDGRRWEDWTFPAEIPLVQEDGELRVCFPRSAVAG